MRTELADELLKTCRCRISRERENASRHEDTDDGVELRDEWCVGRISKDYNCIDSNVGSSYSVVML